MPKDVLDALQELEFDAMLPRVQAEVHKFTSIQADKRNTYRKKVREDKKAAKEKEAPNGVALGVAGGVAGAAGVAAAGGAMMALDGDEESPPAKRARLDGEEEEFGEGEGDETVDVDGQEEDEEVEDDEVEEDDEGQEEGLTEDLLEEREDEDEDMEDAEDSD